MNKLELTAEHFKRTDLGHEYCGTVDLGNYNGDVYIAGALGWVRFARFAITGSLVAGAGTGIKAGEGIEAGLFISCKLALSFRYRLFAGTATWRDVDDEDKAIKCGLLKGGSVCYGDVTELGMPEQTDCQAVETPTLEGRVTALETRVRSLDLP